MKRLIIILFLTLLIMPVSLVHAIDEDEVVNFGEFPDKLAEALNIDLPSAKLLSCSIILCLFLFPSMLIGGWFGGLGGAILSIVVVGLPVGGFLVSMGWLPIWVYVMLCIIVALMFSGKMRGWISGSGDRGD